MKTEKRIQWIDIARGFFIIAIVLGHVYSTGVVRSWVFSFHVPAFFFLSGYCFHYIDSFMKYLFRKIRTIVVPYLFYSIASICMFAAASAVKPSIGSMLECSFSANVITMLYGNSKPDVMKYNLHLWFLTCFFMVSILAYLAERMYRKYGNTARYAALIVGIVSNFFFSQHETIALPWHFETALSMLVWFLIGVIMKEHANDLTKPCGIRNKYLKQFLPIGLILIGEGLSLLNTRTLGVRNEHYGFLPIYYMAAAFGIIGFIELSIWIRKCRLLEYIGRKSMALLVLHKFPILFFKELFPPTARILEKPDSISGFLCGILVLIITISSVLLIEKGIDRFLPWSLGYIKSGGHTGEPRRLTHPR